MEAFRYGQSLGKETISSEYKEFSFYHSGIPYDKKEITEFLTSFRWDFNDLVSKSIKNYLDIYLPKYACGFLDQNSETDHGELYIGVDDNGFVHGIPYQGEIGEIGEIGDIGEIGKIGITSNSDWKKYVKIEFIPVSYSNEKPLKEVLPAMSNYYQSYEKIQSIVRIYETKYKKWQAQNDYYSQKLIELYNNKSTYHRFLNYMKRECENYDEIVDDNFVFEQKTHEEITRYRMTPDNIYYFICRWKDQSLEKIRRNKPKPLDWNLLNSYIRYGPVAIFTQCNNIIPWWMKHNQDMRLYVVKISFTKPFLDIDIKYKNLKYYRTMTHKNGPCCKMY